jgi:magnesium-transporting ATPase (P-type)
LAHSAVILGIFALINFVFLKDGVPSESAFPYLAPSTHWFVFTANLTVFFFANAAALFFKHLKFLKILVYIGLIVAVSIFFGDIVSFVISKTAAFFFDTDLLFRVIPIMLAANVYFILVTFVQSRTIDLKK